MFLSVIQKRVHEVRVKGRGEGGHQMFKGRFLVELLLLLALTTNFAFSYMLPLLWKEEGVLYFFTLIMLSFITGMMILNVKKTFIYFCICSVTGAILAAEVYILPAVIFGELWKIDLAIASLVPVLARGVVINLAFCVFVAIIGCYIGQVITGEDRLV